MQWKVRQLLDTVEYQQCSFLKARNGTDMNARTAENINTLARFCGVRDLNELSHNSLYQKYQLESADVMVLIGGCVMEGADLFAKAIRDGIAKNYIIIGGEGHTTETFRRKVHSEYPCIETAGLAEAEVFQEYLQKVHGCRADFLETKSTNCGNNIMNLLALLESNSIQYKSIILCQDATMQKRIDAVMRKYAGKDKTVINFAAYEVDVRYCDCGESGNTLTYSKEIHGMWEMGHYIDLLMGEIPRLTDDESGYGPRGKDFIAHVEVPANIRQAFTELQEVLGNKVREANPLYASK